MSRSSQLQCGTSSRLRRRAPLLRSAPLRSGPLLLPADVRRVVEARSGGVCEVARTGCDGRARDVHHRVLRGAGGRHGAARAVADLLSNLLHVCRGCHEWVHDNRAAARRSGWTLGGRDVPAMVELLYRGEPGFLDDLGGVHAFEAVGA